MQLTLELTHEKSCRILDTLVLEALRGVNIKELEKNLPKTSDVFLSDDVKTACSVLADSIIVGLYEYLAPMKASACSDKLGLRLELGSFAAGVMISTDLAQHTLKQKMLIAYISVHSRVVGRMDKLCIKPNLWHCLREVAALRL
ncbi:uncharacterized protein LOC114284330 isoform X2 [Camellia sinensis]|nr:uncharacterized protein LOC114284330 isoform X2 [Camellia sinensis]